MKRQQTTGYLFAFGASLALASSFVFSKSALNQLHMVQFGLVWFSMGVLWNGIWFLMRRDYRHLRYSFRVKTMVALMIAILEGIATGLFYMAIREMENPAVVSFIGNIGPVFVTVMGILLLKERFNPWQLGGIIIAICGIFVINYREGSFGGFLEPGSVYVILASFFFSVATILGRKRHALLQPGYMSLIRSFILALAMLVIFISQDQQLVVAPSG